MIPDWQLPPGVDRGLWDYLHAADMVSGYDEQMRRVAARVGGHRVLRACVSSPGAVDRSGMRHRALCLHFAAKGFDCVGVDLSDEMLSKARTNATAANLSAEWVKGNLTDLSAQPEASFDYAACLFSTLGMVRGPENRAKVLANAFRLLKPGGQLVLHVHNRFFRGLGWKSVASQWLKSLLKSATAGDIAMSQAYGGAPLTLHHFVRCEAPRMLEARGFTMEDQHPLGTDGTPTTGSRIYGWLLLAERPV